MKRFRIVLLSLFLNGCASTTPDIARNGTDALASSAQNEMAGCNYGRAERRIDKLGLLGLERKDEGIIAHSLFLRAQLQKLKGDIDDAYSLLNEAEQKLYIMNDFLGLAVVQAERGTLLASEHRDSEACDSLISARNNYRKGIISNPRRGIPVQTKLGSFEKAIEQFLNELK
jgi:hypothetical protein